MNMLIIGNGFDIAHGRPTKYEDFLNFIEQIIRTKTYHGTKDEFESTIPALHLDVKQYILSAFETRVISVCETTSNKNKMVQEIYECVEENIWYEYFQTIVRENKIRGKNWIDFESEIQEIIKVFDKRFHDLYEPFVILSQEKKTLSSKIRLFYSKLNFSKYNAQKGRIKDYRPTCLDFIEKTYQDLEALIRCLEIYLDDCVVKGQVACYSPDIQELKIDSVLSFNYTSTPKCIYPSLTNTHYIHGRAKSDRPATENNMVLGVNEYWDDHERDFRTNFNCYKKFVQRIIKETGFNYKIFINYILTERRIERSYRNNHVYIFGHSLDVTDGDILREVIRTPDVDTTIFYRNKQQQANQIANLSKVLGQDELLKRVFSTSPTIIFKQQQKMLERSTI